MHAKTPRCTLVTAVGGGDGEGGLREGPCVCVVQTAKEGVQYVPWYGFQAAEVKC